MFVFSVEVGTYYPAVKGLPLVMVMMIGSAVSLRGYWNLDWFGLVLVHGGVSGAEKVQGELMSNSHLSPIPLPLESQV